MREARRLIGLILAVCILLCLGHPVRALAGEAPKVMQTVTDEESVKIYARGAEVTENAEYQIGNIPTDPPVSFAISEDGSPMRTLIMVDNSLSIPTASRTKIKESIKAIVQGHAENEQFRLAVFAEEIDYLSDSFTADYTALQNVADSIGFYDQDTYLTDVLYEVIDDLNDDHYQGYTRIIIVSDGVDQKPIGVTREELNKKMEDTPYPVYSLGSSTGSNGNALENMFAISRATGCEYMILEDSTPEQAAEMTARDNSITVFRAVIPDDAKVGGRQNSKLTLPGGNAMIFSVDVPFSIRQETASEPAAAETKPAGTQYTVTVNYLDENGVPIAEAYSVSVNEGDSYDLEQYAGKEVDGYVFDKSEGSLKGTISGGDVEINVYYTAAQNSKKRGIIVITTGAVLLLAAAGAAAFFLRNKKKRKKSQASEPIEEEFDEIDPYEATVVLNDPRRDSSGTVLLTPGGPGNAQKRYRVVLEDTENASRTFRCDLIDEIKIGRRTDNNIVISDDAAVHGHQGTISVKGGVFYLTDLPSVQNHMSVNQNQLKPGLPQVIVSNSLVTIGQHTYTITITKI